MDVIIEKSYDRWRCNYNPMCRKKVVHGSSNLDGRACPGDSGDYCLARIYPRSRLADPYGITHSLWFLVGILPTYKSGVRRPDFFLIFFFLLYSDACVVTSGRIHLHVNITLLLLVILMKRHDGNIKSKITIYTITDHIRRL